MKTTKEKTLDITSKLLLAGKEPKFIADHLKSRGYTVQAYAGYWIINAGLADRVVLMCTDDGAGAVHTIQTVSID
jgi:hypothetical protein